MVVGNIAIKHPNQPCYFGVKLLMSMNSWNLSTTNNKGTFGHAVIYKAVVPNSWNAIPWKRQHFISCQCTSHNTMIFDRYNTHIQSQATVGSECCETVTTSLCNCKHFRWMSTSAKCKQFLGVNQQIKCKCNAALWYCVFNMCGDKQHKWKSWRLEWNM